MTESPTEIRTPLAIFSKYWKRFASFLGRWNSKLLLTLVYVLFVVPISLVLKLVRKDLLDRKFNSGTSYWKDKEPVDSSLERNKYQF